MSHARNFFFCLTAAVVAVAAQAQTVPPVSSTLSSTITNALPPLPTVQSPVSYFRQLLSMSPAERNQALAGRTKESRDRIMAKVREYMKLGPDERELRLAATELRWYLVPLMRTVPGDRDPQLATVPAELRDLAKSRLAQWDLLPPALQQEFLAHDTTLHYLTQPSVQPASTNMLPDRIAEQFSQFLDFTPAEQQRLLGTLSGAERAQMEKTLNSFAQLPPQQRFQCIRNYAKFAGMSGAERAEFLKNAESWSKMSPQERQSWRDLVDHMPLWPPTPSAIMPPMPPKFTPRVPKASMATN